MLKDREPSPLRNAENLKGKPRMIAAVQLSWQAEQQRGDKCSDHSRYGKLQQEKGTEAIHLIYDPCCVGWVIYWGERGGSMGNQGN